MKTFADHITDITLNSIAAKANLIEIMVEEDKSLNLYTIKIKDNGCGMSKELSQQAVQPFFTTRKTRKIGLGLSFFKQNAEQTGGSFELQSAPGKGTCVKAVFKHNHIDRPAIGDLAEAYILLLISHEGIDFHYTHKTGDGEYKIKSAEILQKLGNISLTNSQLRNALKEMIDNNLTEINITR